MRFRGAFPRVWFGFRNNLNINLRVNAFWGIFDGAQCIFNRLYFDFFFQKFCGRSLLCHFTIWNTFSLCNVSIQCSRYVIVMHKYSAKFPHVSLWTMIIIINDSRSGIQPFELARLNGNGSISDGLKGERLTNCSTVYIYSCHFEMY